MFVFNLTFLVQLRLHCNVVYTFILIYGLITFFTLRRFEIFLLLHKDNLFLKKKSDVVSLHESKEDLVHVTH
jgi:hypothetical protein